MRESEYINKHNNFTHAPLPLTENENHMLSDEKRSVRESICNVR